MILIYIVCLAPLFSISYTLQCMNENNKPVDWFYVYKLPRDYNKNQLIHNGLAYMFLTSDESTKWQLSNFSIGDERSMIGNTLHNLYRNKENTLNILYNDQPPNKHGSANKGHTKGTVLANENGGLWLIHSVPHFPDPNGYSYPETGTHYGQSLLCISLNLENLNKVGQHLQYNEPEIYSKNLVDSKLDNAIPELIKAAKGQTVKNSPWFYVGSISSINGLKFTSLAKSKKFEKDLYEDLVAPTLLSDLYVETWPNEPGRLLSNCTKQYKVYNILSVQVRNADLTFTSTTDHSKWAVSPSGESGQWVCVGDINRAEPQKHRGGGTVCLNNKIVATNYQKTIYKVQQCAAH